MSTARSGSASGSSAGKWAAVLGGLALVAFLLAWLLGWIRFTTDPRVLEIRAMQDQARQTITASGGPKTVAEATAAVAAMGQIREKIEALPPHLRQQVERSGGSMFREAFRARMDEYFTASPQQRLAVLDRQIDQEEMMRKAFEAGRSVMAAVGGGGGGNAGSTNAGGAGSGTSGDGGTGRPRGSRTEEDRNKWRKSMIDRTTPEQRARYVEYRRAMEDRREKRGLPAGPGR